MIDIMIYKFKLINIFYYTKYKLNNHVFMFRQLKFLVV